MILLPSSSSTSHSVAGVAIFLVGPGPPPLQQCTGSLARAFSLFGRLCAVDHASPHLVSLVPGSPPSSLHRWFSQEVSPRLDRDLRHRLSAMVFDLHGVLVDAFSDNFLPVRENPVYSFNLPPSALRLWGLARWSLTTPLQAVPLVTGRVLPPAPFAKTRTAPSCITFPPTTTLELLGLTPVASPCLKLRRWHNTVACSSPR